VLISVSAATREVESFRSSASVSLIRSAILSGCLGDDTEVNRGRDMAHQNHETCSGLSWRSVEAA